MNDDLIVLIGTAESRLRRTKDKNVRAETLDLIQKESLPPEQRLRGYLVIGRTPPPELLSETNISNALQIQAAFSPPRDPRISQNAEEPRPAIGLRLKRVKVFPGPQERFLHQVISS